jgi:hypothetical protein
MTTIKIVFFISFLRLVINAGAELFGIVEQLRGAVKQAGGACG